jgi:hypothetical protein
MTDPRPVRRVLLQNLADRARQRYAIAASVDAQRQELVRAAAADDQRLTALLPQLAALVDAPGLAEAWNIMLTQSRRTLDALALMEREVHALRGALADHAVVGAWPLHGGRHNRRGHVRG